VKAVVWDPPAIQELNDALSVSRDTTEFRRVVDEAIEDIASGRVTHAQVPRTPARRCVLTTPPYSIVYTETDDEIRVWAFPHHKRKPGYWKKRLPKH
jgi:plasmid stabilization system protein ParE